MGAFSNVQTDNSIQDEKDSLGGRRVLDSDIYLLTVDLAYATKSSSGAQGLVVHFRTETGQEHRETFWVTSGNAKGNKNFYENKNGERQYLPGFTMATALSLLTVGKELKDVVDEEKVVKLYSSDAKAEVPTKVAVLTELLGKQVYGAIFRQTVNKQVKGDNGYVDTAEAIETNELDKLFRASDKMTVAEVRAQSAEPNFFNAWIERWKGKVRDRMKKIDAGAQTAAGFTTGGTAANGNKPTKSLFAPQ